MLNSMDSSEPNRTPHSRPTMATAEPSAKPGSRLANLRGKVTAASLRGLSCLRQPGPASESEESDQRGEEDKLGAAPERSIQTFQEAPEEAEPRRLSSLRGLVTVADLQELGPKKGLHAAAEPLDKSAGDIQHARDQGESATDKAMVATAADPAGTAKESSGLSENEVMKPQVASSKPQMRAERIRADEIEEILTLPSKRGQYRQKK
jgi:hypothetical protein